MFERYFIDAFTKHVGHLVENLDPEKVRLSVPRGKVVPEDLVLRAAVVHNFDDTKAVELLRRMEARYWTFSAKQLEKDLKLQMCVPVPSLKTSFCACPNEIECGFRLCRV